MFNWLRKLITEPPVIDPSIRAKIKKTLLMVGITPEEQQELFDLGLHKNPDNLVRGQALTDAYERRGAKFVYIVENGKFKRNPALSDIATDEPPQLEDYADYEAYEKARQKWEYRKQQDSE